MVAADEATKQKGLLKIEVKNLDKLNAKIQDAVKNSKDLRAAFTLIQRQEFKFQRLPFTLKSKGKYVDYKRGKDGKESRYKIYKQKTLGSAYPMLFFSGRLANSLTNPGGYNISDIQPKYLRFGTRVPYGRFHQEGTRKMPRRPFLFIDDQRLRNYSNILKAHLTKPFTQKEPKLDGP